MQAVSVVQPKINYCKLPDVYARIVLCLTLIVKSYISGDEEEAFSVPSPVPKIQNLKEDIRTLEDINLKDCRIF